MDNLRKLLIAHEGLRLKPYRDTVGKLTIGVGRNLDDVGISNDEAMVLLDTDVTLVKEKCLAVLPWMSELNEPRQAVLFSMAFNMGIGGLLEFRQMLAFCEAHQWENTAIEMLNSKWANQVGSRAIDLAAMMTSGEFPN